MNRPDALARIETKLGYVFRDRSLLQCALTHSSYAHEFLQAASNHNGRAGRVTHYERFEFLGDAVLALVISDLIMRKFPQAAEGELSRIRAGLVCAERLAEQARSLDLGTGLRLGKGEQASGGSDKPSILADVYEAVIAALYLDAGFEKARKIITSHFAEIIKTLPALDLLGDYKTPLQEKAQARFKVTPRYGVINEEGPDHMKTFEVELIINGKAYARGRGRSKKEAEQDAARKVLDSGVMDD